MKTEVKASLRASAFSLYEQKRPDDVSKFATFSDNSAFAFVYFNNIFGFAFIFFAIYFSKLTASLQIALVA